MNNEHYEEEASIPESAHGSPRRQLLCYCRLNRDSPIFSLLPAGTVMLPNVRVLLTVRVTMFASRDEQSLNAHTGAPETERTIMSKFCSERDVKWVLLDGAAL